MHSTHLAEWILGLVTSRDRAVCTVGDLVEEASSRGAVWFWSGIVRIAASLLWRGVAENPLRLAGVVFIGLAVDVLASLLVAALSGLVFFFVARSGHPLQGNSVWWTIGLDAPTLFLSLWIGRMLARWAPGRELSACLAYWILGSLFSLVMMFVDPGGLGPSALIGVFLIDLLQRTPVLAGAVWGHHRTLAAR
jgi:hypothetical protein